MNVVTIKLATSSMFLRALTAGSQLTITQADLDQYKLVEGFSVQTNLAGEAAAEEMFDLTNNPSRSNERLATYGRVRSLSTGDIVVINGTEQWLCCSMGWQLLAS